MGNLRGRTSRAFLWDLFGNYGSQVSSFVISIFLARLLSPEDFGLVGLSMVFISMLNIFQEMGFASALIQNEKNTSLTYSSVFFLNVSAGLVLTVGVFFSGPLIGAFFDQPIITDLVRLLSIAFFFTSFNIVQVTILRKALDFKKLTFRRLTAQLCAGVIAVVFAYLDYGVYALVIQQIVAAAISTALLWKITNWYPKWEFSWSEIKKLSSFSLYVFAASSVNKIIEQLDTLVIGKLFSPTTLGFFSRANSLNNLVTKNSSASIAKVFFPALTQVKDDSERFERIYLKVINMVASIAIFLTCIFYLIGEELIIGLFGVKWKLSIPVFQILILKGFTYPISAMIVNAFLAKGKSKANFHFGNIRKVLQLIPFVFAYFGGFYPFLYANIVVAFLAWILNNIFAHLSLNITLKNQYLAVIPQLFFAFIFVLSIMYFFPNDFSYFWAVGKVIVFGTLFMLFLKLSKAPIVNEGSELIAKFKNRLNRDN
jgi:O-antigen/teichoic acid export membrane protein